MSGDWRSGEPAIQYARCRSCGQAWYLPRARCPRCAAPDPAILAASGMGVVVAATRVERAPSAEWRAAVPYTIALVDAAEGFRMMAHAAAAVTIGAAVVARFHRVGGALLPRFEPVPP